MAPFVVPDWGIYLRCYGRRSQGLHNHFFDVGWALISILFNGDGGTLSAGNGGELSDGESDAFPISKLWVKNQ